MDGRIRNGSTDCGKMGGYYEKSTEIMRRRAPAGSNKIRYGLGDPGRSGEASGWKSEERELPKLAEEEGRVENIMKDKYTALKREITVILSKSYITSNLDDVRKLIDKDILDGINEVVFFFDEVKANEASTSKDLLNRIEQLDKNELIKVCLGNDIHDAKLKTMKWIEEPEAYNVATILKPLNNDIFILRQYVDP